MKKPPYHAHPWHGIPAFPGTGKEVNAYIEIVPGDTVKYEIDKASGFLKIDRPQLYTNIVPALYGFIPQTYCGDAVADISNKNSTQTITQGDKDPLDILVLCEKTVNQGGILVEAIPIGGLRLIDKGEADDKIISVLKNDAVYGNWTDISDCPNELLNRIMHYFLTYKHIPGTNVQTVLTDGFYNSGFAREVIQLAMNDYESLQ